jgi:hypothetical protein
MIEHIIAVKPTIDNKMPSSFLNKMMLRQGEPL